MPEAGTEWGDVVHIDEGEDTVPEAVTEGDEVVHEAEVGGDHAAETVA